ncbi:MAG: N-acetylmuramoyl-L-alanine amidase [Dinghuibacter sp.]|nr:N-acetylmuramoyl-L-alanine amidase [Dinghuibacter sp.]
METRFGFTKMTITEFEHWMAAERVARTIIYLQQHHTWSPDYSSFNGNNHFELQRNMRDHHVNHNGWSNIGQHFSIFPDGAIVTGRSLETSPACIFGNNANAICIENVGNFDTGKDTMRSEQAEAIIRATAAICRKFSIPLNTDKVVYHHWFDLSSGARNNGTRNNKSCPGTAFFGGNKVADCERNFLPLVNNVLNGIPVQPAAPILKYVAVTANTLNIRKQPNAQSDKVPDREPAIFGAILRVFKIQNGWYKISSSKQHWVSGAHTKDVLRATVNADTLNVRIGPGTSFSKTGSVVKGTELFISEEQDGWCRISFGDKWVKKEFLSF